MTLTDGRRIAVRAPFCDDVGITCAGDDALHVTEAITGLVLEAGGSIATEGLLTLGDGGTVKLGTRWGVFGASLSGAALAQLRAVGLFEPALALLGSVPHRVTRLHATLDVEEDAPAVLNRLYRRARKGEFQLTRKKIPRRKVSQVRRVCHVTGRDTGTLYLGDKRASVVSLAIYDKRNQLLDRLLTPGRIADIEAAIALNDPGPLTRYELRFGRASGVSLRDAADPTALFWAFMPANVLRAPAGVPSWSPLEDGGWVQPPAPPPNHWKQLDMLLDSSPDVARLVRLCALLGPDQALARVSGKLRRRVEQALGGLGAPPTKNPNAPASGATA